MQPGDKLAHYEVRAPLGKGGMGEVFLANDTKLGRDVALKILPADFANDSERVARFQREAQVLASLNHPNISAIYGLEEDQGKRFLVMELMKGQDLSERLKAGPIPEDEALEIIRRIADGLTAAHRNGIVHRDLKPANVMITPEGTVKVLDFGLARAYTEDVDEGSDPTFSPTITAAMTQAGTILGTAAYMAPEQARGKPVDNRADIWAMAAILFEMLSGRRLFEGETISDVLASVIKVEPDLDALPSDTSPQVRRMLQRCLVRDPRKRLHSAADAILELDEVVPETAAAAAGRRPVLPWILAGFFALALVVAWMRPTAGPTEVLQRQYDLAFPRDLRSDRAYLPIVSPDGKWLATALEDSTGSRRILLRSLETGKQEFVESTLGAEFPFWSPDSRFLGFFQRGLMRKLHIESNTLQLVTREVKNYSRGASWSTTGTILFAPGSNHGFLLVDAEGGPARVVTTVDSTMVDGSHRWPQFLPDGNRFVFTKWSNVQAERADHGGIYLGTLDGAEHRRLLRDASAAVVSPSGHLFFQRNGRLMSVAFDTDSGQVTGDPQLVADNVAFLESNGAVGVSASGRGDIFLSEYDPNTGMRLGWTGRKGQPLETITEDLPIVINIDLAADEKHYCLEWLDEVGSVEIWIGNIERKSLSRLSRTDNDCWGVGFSPDGTEVAYAVQNLSGGVLYRHEISGAQMPEPILELDETNPFLGLSHWFTTDQALIVRSDSETEAIGIYLLDLMDKKMTPVLADEFDQTMPRISPDGRWLAYMSTESGTPEIYIRNWPGLDNKWQVSRAGGVIPHWNSQGTELLFESPGGRRISAVDFEGSGDEPDISLPRRITVLPPNMLTLNATADHQRYLIGYSLADPELPPVRVLVGWDQATP